MPLFFSEDPPMRTRPASSGTWPCTLLFIVLLAAAASAQQDRYPQAGLGGVAQGDTLSKSDGYDSPEFDLDGDQRRAYDRGRQRGREDFRASLSRSYRRHDDDYDRYTELSFRRGYEQAYDELSEQGGGMTPVQRVHYDDGFRRGRDDREDGRSRNYKRYRDEYDSRYEKYFRRGYEAGYDRQPR
jgi:hypothetical protein